MSTAGRQAGAFGLLGMLVALCAGVGASPAQAFICKKEANSRFMVQSSAAECSEELAANDGEWVLAVDWQNNGFAVMGSVKTKEQGKFVRTDLAAKVSLECDFTATGTVGVEGSGQQTTFTATKCKTLEGTCPSPSAESVGLPWNTQLAVEGSSYVDQILSKSGWKVTCAGIIKDTCEAEPGVPWLEVTKLGAVIEEEFVSAKNENAETCSLTKEKKGDIAGAFTLEGAEAGNSISVE